MYIAPQNLDGFNPLKAIGRALGATGRAAVGAVLPGADKVLQAAATMPAAKTSAPSAVATAVTQATQPVVAPIAGPTVESVNTALLDMLKKFASIGQPAAPAAPAPTTAPAPTPIVITAPAPSASQSAGANLPTWAIPAMIGAAALLFVSSRK